MERAFDRPGGSSEPASRSGIATEGTEAPSSTSLQLVPSWPELPARAAEVLTELIEGNARFRNGTLEHPRKSADWRLALLEGQHPKVGFFGCVDSRVPDDIVFDQGLGDLFTIRTAGHVLDDAAQGSLEYGVEHLHIPLIIVLGHEKCGAVTAAIEVVEHGVEVPPAIGTLVEAIRPAVEATRGITDLQARVNATAQVHTRLTVARLLKRSPVIAEAVHAGELGIVTAGYALESGLVSPV